MCSGRVGGSLFAEPHTENGRNSAVTRDKERAQPLKIDLGPWNIDRLRRQDNGGGNGVYASRRYVLLDR